MTDERRCGTCTACCVHLWIPELDKAEGDPCPALKNHQCSMYEARPGTCREWRCMWIDGFGKPTDRPDKTGLLVYVQRHTSKLSEETVAVWETAPGALEARAGKKVMKRLRAEHSDIFIRHHDKTVTIEGSGEFMERARRIAEENDDLENGRVRLKVVG